MKARFIIPYRLTEYVYSGKRKKIMKRAIATRPIIKNSLPITVYV